ncbi:hypothetical protein PUNSTDRAFT_124754 [Punctularia strigosozonata HHB-11173 SS5]|uniref:uncharacterized protein n=1 Tax=Punctularia strigosozonata (strain HHB-11173) TaxID=741275 RepID=UPI0004416CAF|nr:uncharacterized protein PUNSTDRAFT_124754 [Punctularia strigosozonata HHB-11173 SS5]EIN11370.1 hypothetical protein PUNSTDRAFT_124754 [Punctularia strigosozonata HHB-11173 SS5]
MADTPAGSDSGASPQPDDSQLTIRIPNPKMYMQRQSQWKGRRGKPRCDHCRLNNLKCDRVLPTCNHCGFGAGRVCKYTPLPTPAHRGIPRCDRCRLKNLKCNRDLPICNHCSEDGETECVYTPKKRHKVPSDHNLPTRDRPVMPYTAKTASFLVSDIPSFNVAFPVKDGQHGPSFASTSASVSAYPSTGTVASAYTHASHSISGYPPPLERTSASGSDMDERDRDRSPPLGTMPYAPLGPRTEYQAHYWTPKPTLPPLSRTHTSTSSLPVVGRSQFDPNVVLAPPHVEPWLHPAFAPLPSPITNYLTQTANAIEMPARHAFDDALARFLGDLSAELKATAALAPDPYANVCKAIQHGDTAALGPRLHMWVTFHHVRAGSTKMHLLVLLRDDRYGIGRDEEERRREELAMRVDHQWYGEAGEKVADAVPEISDTFERFPVQQQIFDILVYAHRNHGSAADMLAEVRAVGMASITWPMAEMFVRLCPLCNLRAKAAPAPPPTSTGSPSLAPTPRPSTLSASTSTAGTPPAISSASFHNIPPSGTRQYPARF